MSSRTGLSGDARSKRSMCTQSLGEEDEPHANDLATSG